MDDKVNNVEQVICGKVKEQGDKTTGRIVRIVLMASCQRTRWVVKSQRRLILIEIIHYRMGKTDGITHFGSYGPRHFIRD